MKSIVLVGLTFVSLSVLILVFEQKIISNDFLFFGSLSVLSIMTTYFCFVIANLDKSKNKKSKKFHAYRKQQKIILARQHDLSKWLK